MKRQIALWIISLCLLPSRTLSDPKQTAWMIWEDDGRCAFKISRGTRVWIEAPMVNGKPDKSRAELRGMVVEYEPRCGRIEIR